MSLGHRNLCCGWIEIVEPRVGDKEGIAVPQRDEELLHRLSQRLSTRAVVLPYWGRAVVVPAHRIRAEVVEQEIRVQHVAARLRRLLTLWADHRPQAADVAVRVLLDDNGQERE